MASLPEAIPEEAKLPDTIKTEKTKIKSINEENHSEDNLKESESSSPHQLKKMTT